MTFITSSITPLINALHTKEFLSDRIFRFSVLPKNTAGTKNAAGVLFWFFISGKMCHETLMSVNSPSYEYS
jgi:hypothetical protein